jgi:hypothetical protein
MHTAHVLVSLRRVCTLLDHLIMEVNDRLDYGFDYDMWLSKAPLPRQRLQYKFPNFIRSREPRRQKHAL